VAVYRGIDGSDPANPERVERAAGLQEERRATRSPLLGKGTLACPECDAPVAPAGGPMSATDELGCPVCAHAGLVRDFLSLALPSRPARVDVRVIYR
jgi:hypothetical protein